MKSQVQVLLLTSRDTQRWIIPKGNIKAKQRPWQAARAETLEEAGVRGARHGKRPLGFYTYTKRHQDGSQRPVSVEVYLLRATKIQSKWKEREARKRIWLSIPDAIERIEERGVAPLLERLLQIEPTLRSRS